MSKTRSFSSRITSKHERACPPEPMIIILCIKFLVILFKSFIFKKGEEGKHILSLLVL